MIRSDEHGRILLGTEENPITTYAINSARLQFCMAADHKHLTVNQRR